MFNAHLAIVPEGALMPDPIDPLSANGHAPDDAVHGNTLPRTLDDPQRDGRVPALSNPDPAAAINLSDAATRIDARTRAAPGAAATETPSASRYLLGDEIARGGMGVVYRATDTILGREVAVKVLQEKFDPIGSAARRFIDEAP